MYCLSEILTFSHTFSCSDFPVACCRQPFLKWLCKGRNATRLISSQTSNANIRVSLKDSSKPRSVWLFSVDITRAACFFRILIYYTIVCGKPIVAQFKSSSSYERDRERVRDRQKEKDRKYTEKIDVWSVGCILGEMLKRQPLFPGSDYINQLILIVNTLGTPCENDMAEVESLKARKFIKSLNDGAPIQKIPFAAMFPQVDPLTIDLLEKMLEFNPKTRISVTEALYHPLFDGLRDAHQIQKDYLDTHQFLASTVKVPIPNDERNKPLDVGVYKQKIIEQIRLIQSNV